jgi:glycosyltransferase involved in cell wall biosynthesis
VFVAPNALDQSLIERERERWIDDEEALSLFRAREGLAGKPLVLFVSRLLRGNRIDVLIHAAGLLARRIPDLLVAIIGTGEAESHLRALTLDLNLERSVRFVGALYDEASLAPWFLSAAVFCYPANVGLSLLHAFGYGVPAVVGDDLSSHNPEIEALRPGKNGLTFHHADPESLATVLETILSDTTLRGSMSREALETVQSSFSIGAMVAGFKDAIAYARGARP